MIVFLKMAWFLWIALFPLWFGLIGGLYLLFLEWRDNGQNKR